MSPRDLPAVHAVLDQADLADALARHGRGPTLEAVRRAIDEARERLRRGEAGPVDAASLAMTAARYADQTRPLLRRVINATGILLHTGLGRAPLSEAAIGAVAKVARGYCNLELDLDSGDRLGRTTGVAKLLARLTGAEAATVVNNNAGATVLALRALAIGREVVVSRGQLIEIGGSFRLPEIFEVSGAKLREVGTTNRTRLADYERAIGPETAVLLRVHPSNFRVVGFTESVGIAELAALAHARGLMAIDDIGSGALTPSSIPGLADEPTAAEGLAAGADLVLCSGDKLLGGPQSGLILGRKGAVARVESDPLMRALRVDKMTLAALEVTLRQLLDPGRTAELPLRASLDATPGSLLARAGRIAGVLREEASLDASAVESVAYVGGGSLPGSAIPSAAVRVAGPFPEPWSTEGRWSRALRLGEPSVVARVHQGAVLFDLRAVGPGEDDDLLRAIRQPSRPDD